MENMGLVTKQTNPDDVRSFLVFPTIKAAQIYPKTREVISSWTKDVTSTMTETEKGLFYKLMDTAARQATEICNKS